MFNRLIKFLLIYSFLIDRPVRSDENSFSCKETEDKDYDKWIGNMIEEGKYCEFDDNPNKITCNFVRLF